MPLDNSMKISVLRILHGASDYSTSTINKVILFLLSKLKKEKRKKERNKIGIIKDKIEYTAQSLKLTIRLQVILSKSNNVIEFCLLSYSCKQS